MRVFKLQKRAARVISEAYKRSNSVKLFKKLEWLPFYDKVKLNKSVLVLKRLLGSCPAYICTIYLNLMQTYIHELVVIVNQISPTLVSIAKPREGGPLAYLQQGCGTSYLLT